MARAAMQEVIRSILTADEAETFINEHALDFTVHVSRLSQQSPDNSPNSWMLNAANPSVAYF